jgi:hypothetical protein
MVSEKFSILVKFWTKKVHFDLYVGRLMRKYIYTVILFEKNKEFIFLVSFFWLKFQIV